MMLLIILVASLIADYPLQGFFLADYKSKSWVVMTIHCLIWAGSVSIVMYFMGIFAWWMLAFLFIGHYAMDKWKSKHPTEEKYVWTYYVDQAFHLVQLLLVWGIGVFF